MCAPSMTFFCINGHIVEDSPHHGIPNTEIGITACGQCGSKDIKTVFEWGDAGYAGGDIVPTEPIGYYRTVIPVHIGVYDVSKLFVAPKTKKRKGKN